MGEIFTAEVIRAIVAALGTLTTAAIIFVCKRVAEWLKTRIGEANFNRALKVAVGIWKQLEEEYANIPKSGDQKKAKMEEMLLKTFPKLTKEELDSINKQVHMAITNSLVGATEAIGVKDIIS